MARHVLFRSQENRAYFVNVLSWDRIQPSSQAGVLPLSGGVISSGSDSLWVASNPEALTLVAADIQGTSLLSPGSFVDTLVDFLMHRNPGSDFDRTRCEICKDAKVKGDLEAGRERLMMDRPPVKESLVELVTPSPESILQKVVHRQVDQHQERSSIKMAAAGSSNEKRLVREHRTSGTNTFGSNLSRAFGSRDGRQSPPESYKQGRPIKIREDECHVKEVSTKRLERKQCLCGRRVEGITVKMKFYFELDADEKLALSDIAVDVQEVKALFSCGRRLHATYISVTFQAVVTLQSRLGHSLVARIDSANEKRYHLTEKRFSCTHPVLTLHFERIT